MKLKFIDTAHPLYAQERDLRFNVLRKPLGLLQGTEIFPFEDKSLHLVALDEDRVVGCVLFCPEGTGGRMYQMAVAEDYQNKGIGRQLVAKMESHLAKQGFKDVYIHARHYAAPFYKKLGYSSEGHPFTEIGIEHFLMRKKLS